MRALTTKSISHAVQGGEWCYVEVQLLGKGTSDWNYCLPPLNYGNLSLLLAAIPNESYFAQLLDKIRLKARQAFEMKAAEGEAMVRSTILRKGAIQYRFPTRSCGLKAAFTRQTKRRRGEPPWGHSASHSEWNVKTTGSKRFAEIGMQQWGPN